MLEEEELFPYLPPLTPPRKSISKGFSASFKSGPVVTKIQSTDIFKMKRIEANNCENIRLKKKRNWKYLCIFSTTSNFLATALRFYFLKICRISRAAFNSVGKLLQCGRASLERPFRYLGQECASHCCYVLRQNIETVTLSIYIARFVGASEEKRQ